MRRQLFIVFFIVFYLLIGLLCYMYFKYIKHDSKEKWYFYIFFYGMRFRIVLTGILALLAADLCIGEFSYSVK